MELRKGGFNKHRRLKWQDVPPSILVVDVNFLGTTGRASVAAQVSSSLVVERRRYRMSDVNTWPHVPADGTSTVLASPYSFHPHPLHLCNGIPIPLLSITWLPHLTKPLKVIHCSSQLLLVPGWHPFPKFLCIIKH